MVYIYNKKINGQDNYYLRVSKRQKNRVITKDIAYLGNDIGKVRDKLNNLTHFKDEIRKSYKTLNKFIENNHYLKKAKQLKLKRNEYLSEDLLEEVEATQLHYHTFLRKNTATKDDVYAQFVIDFVFNSNAIEGNTITLAETEKLLKENIAPKNKTLKEIYDIKNSQKVFLNIKNARQELSEQFIIRIHDELLENIDERKGYRTEDIRVIGGGFKATPSPFISTDMHLLIKFYGQNANLHPLVLASIMHHKLEKIHPFYDGNGRAGRMMLNYLLIKNNYPPLIIRKKTRNDYLDALKKADSSGLNEKKPDEYRKLIEYIAQELIASYWNNFLI